ncbi:MAG: hypothetical protein WBA39_15605, partial [Rivularia sp. (in: cyanobacteria)]
LLFLKERGFLDASLGCATLRSLTIPPRPFRVSQCPRLTIQILPQWKVKKAVLKERGLNPTNFGQSSLQLSYVCTS